MKSSPEAHLVQVWVEGMVQHAGDATLAALEAGIVPKENAVRFGAKMAGNPRAKALLDERLARIRSGWPPMDRALFVRNLVLKLRSEGEDAAELIECARAIAFMRFVGVPAFGVSTEDRAGLVNLARKDIFNECPPSHRIVVKALLEWVAPEWRSVAPDLVPELAKSDVPPMAPRGTGN